MADTVTAFDPDNVERWNCNETLGRIAVIAASDYDKLLDMYRAAVPDSGRCDIHIPAASPEHNNDTEDRLEGGTHWSERPEPK